MASVRYRPAGLQQAERTGRASLRAPPDAAPLVKVGVAVSRKSGCRLTPVRDNRQSPEVLASTRARYPIQAFCAPEGAGHVACPVKASNKSFADTVPK